MKGLEKLPRSVLATLVIGLGIAFIVLNNPPHHMCDTQTEHFRSQQTSLGDFEKHLRLCRETNSPGGCYEMFSYLNRTLKNFYLVSKECLDLISKNSEVKKTLLEGMELMVRLAWRDEALVGRTDKFNWLGKADMNLFCRLKDRLIVFYGNKTFQDFEKQLLVSLSSDKNANPKTVRKKSILSEYCANYR